MREREFFVCKRSIDRPTEHCQNGMVHLRNFPSNNYTKLHVEEVLIRGTYSSELILPISILALHQSDEESEEKIA